MTVDALTAANNALRDEAAIKSKHWTRLLELRCECGKKLNLAVYKTRHGPFLYGPRSEMRFPRDRQNHAEMQSEINYASMTGEALPRVLRGVDMSTSIGELLGLKTQSGRIAGEFVIEQDCRKCKRPYVVTAAWLSEQIDAGKRTVCPRSTEP